MFVNSKAPVSTLSQTEYDRRPRRELVTRSDGRISSWEIIGLRQSRDWSPKDCDDYVAKLICPFYDITLLYLVLLYDLPYGAVELVGDVDIDDGLTILTYETTTSQFLC